MTRRAEVIWARRLKLLEYKLQGLSPKKAIEAIISYSENEGEPVKERTAWRDWMTMPSWSPTMYKLNDENRDEFIVNLLSGLEQSRKYLMNISRTAQGDIAKVQALKEYRETTGELLEIMQSLGMMPKAPEQIMIAQTNVEVKVNELSAEEEWAKFGDIYHEKWAELRMGKGDESPNPNNQ